MSAFRVRGRFAFVENLRTYARTLRPTRRTTIARSGTHSGVVKTLDEACQLKAPRSSPRRPAEGATHRCEAAPPSQAGDVLLDKTHHRQLIGLFEEHDNELLPGFPDGYNNIHHDQRRHIGYGVWHLRQAATRDPELAEQIRPTLQQPLPAAAAAHASPDGERTD